MFVPPVSRGDKLCACVGVVGRAGVRPGAFAPRSLLFLEGCTPAADSSKVDVGGVRRMKWKVRSGRIVMREGIGVPGFICAVRALNSY